MSQEDFSNSYGAEVGRNSDNNYSYKKKPGSSYLKSGISNMNSNTGTGFREKLMARLGNA